MIEPREGRWTAKPETPRRWVDLLSIATNIVWIVGLFGGAAMPGLLETARALIALVAGTIYTGTHLAVFLASAARLREGRRDRSLSDHLANEEEYAVEVRIETAGATIGIDRGVIWFEGALLGFSGRCTSFLLAATDLAPPTGVVISDLDAPYLPLKLRAGGIFGKVTIRPLFGSRRRFRRRMRAFLRKREPSDAERQWPPLVPYEDRKGPQALT